MKRYRGKIKKYKEKSDCIKDGNYIDDGFSGADFDRPGFKRMMADIETGNVNCVIVKDLSRLGRDYIEAGRLIQKTFPAFHVRFIALTDNFDSQTADTNTKSLILPVKNFINDSYCRDISQKVKSAQRTKREQGKFIGAFAVYGYRKSLEDKNKLCPDDYAAEIVRKIFAWKLEGMSAKAIAQRLNDLGILSPLEYKKSLGEKYSTSFRTNITAKWSAVTVGRILSNEMYTGVMVQGKSGKVNYKVKKIMAKPKEEWVRVEGTHEAVISREDFEIVQELLKVDIRAKAGEIHSHFFSGLLFCGDCQEPMYRRINRYKDISKIYFICAKRNRGQGCTRHSVLEKDLKKVVFRILQIYLSVFWDKCRQMEQIQRMEVDFEEISRFDKELKRLYREQEKYLGLRASLYEDLKTGFITEADFQNFSAIYEMKYEEIKNALRRQEEMQKQLFHNGAASDLKLRKLKEAMKLTNLDRDTLLCFINRIEIFEGKKVYVEFRWKEELF
ncbi:recombinase family protein [Parablautia muri]|uniref:recombinase family protein n=1 Tax=Parablautia muri TaxID=2320879 RepID=UPI002ED1CD98